MKVWRHIGLSFIVSCVILGGGVYYQAGAGEGLPDGFKILQEKMEKNEIPTTDLTKFKYTFPDTMPDEIQILRGYLWCGQHAHTTARGGQGGAVAYLFLINFNKETGEMRFFRAWERAAKIPPGSKILTGKLDSGDKRTIDLQAKDGSAFTIIINDKDHLTVRSPTGYDGEMRKIGTISPPPK